MACCGILQHFNNQECEISNLNRLLDKAGCWQHVLPGRFPNLFQLFRKTLLFPGWLGPRGRNRRMHPGPAFPAGLGKRGDRGSRQPPGRGKNAVRDVAVHASHSVIEIGCDPHRQLPGRRGVALLAGSGEGLAVRVAVARRALGSRDAHKLDLRLLGPGKNCARAGSARHASTARTAATCPAAARSIPLP